MTPAPYRIIRHYGSEGWAFDPAEFETAEAALKDAMSNAHSTFRIVKIIEFKKPLPAPPVLGLFAQLSPEQQARVLAYDGPVSFGSPDLPAAPKPGDAP